MKSIYSISDIDRVSWQEFVNEHANGSFFHTPEYFDAFQCSKEAKSHLVAVIDNNQILGLAIFIIYQHKSILLSQFTKRAIAMAPFIVVDNELVVLDFLYAAVNEYLRGKAIYLELRNVVDLSLFEKANGSLFKVKQHLNIKINLSQTEDELFSGFSSSGRNKIKRAESNSLSFKEIDLNSTRESYDLIQSVYHRIHLPFLNERAYSCLIEAFKETSALRIYGVYKSDTLLSTMIVAFYKNELYSWYLGTKRQHDAVGATELLVWNILKLAKSEQMTVYNWGGAGNPSEKYSVRDFKSKFGGQLQHEYRLLKIYQASLYKLSSIVLKCFRFLL